MSSGGPSSTASSVRSALAPAGAHIADVPQPAAGAARPAPRRAARQAPLAGTQPPTTLLARRLRILIQPGERTPGSYTESSRLQTRPSNPCHGCPQGLGAMAGERGRSRPATALQASVPAPRAAVLRGVERGRPRCGTSNSTRWTGVSAGPAAALAGDCASHGPCSNWKSARLFVQGQYSPSRIAGVVPNSPPRTAVRDGAVMSLAGAGAQQHTASPGVRHHALPPLGLVGPPASCAAGGRVPGVASMGGHGGGAAQGHGSGVDSARRRHASFRGGSPERGAVCRRGRRFACAGLRSSEETRVCVCGRRFAGWAEIRGVAVGSPKGADGFARTAAGSPSPRRFP